MREVYQRRSNRRQPYRNGYYERDFVTRLGTIRLRVARTRGKSFLPRGLEPFQRRAEDVSMLIRETFLRGISTRQVGRVVASGGAPGRSRRAREMRPAMEFEWVFYRLLFGAKRECRHFHGCGEETQIPPHTWRIISRAASAAPAA